MKSTLQDIFIENIKDDSTTGITFIDRRNSTENLSYKKLYLEACYRLNALQEIGIVAGDELVFQFESNKNFIITFWACVFAHILPVPLAKAVDPSTSKKLIGVWSKLNNPHLITDSLSLKGRLESLKEDHPLFEKMVNRFLNFNHLDMVKRAVPLPAKEDDVVFIQFSSGSTGFPKGVTNTNEGIVYNVKNNAKHLNILSSDRFLGWVPLTHDLGIIFFHILPLLMGSPQFLIPTSLFLTYPEVWLKSMSEFKINISGSPNFGYKLILDNIERLQLDQLDLSSVRFTLNSAEPVSVELCRMYSQTFAPCGLAHDTIKPSYGLAEAVLGVSIYYYKEEGVYDEYLLNRSNLNVGDKIELINVQSPKAASFANVGRYYGTEIYIVNADNKIVPEKTLGFIQLKSPAVTKGYYNDKRATEDCLSPEGWLNTGDIGFLIDGHLVVTGRAKEMIVINGQNYFPNDIDRILEELPEITFQQAVSCDVFNHSRHSDEIFVFVLYKNPISSFIPLAMNIKKHISDTMGLEVSKVIAVDQIPKTTSGKVQRYLLKQNYEQGEYAPFLKELEMELATIKKNLLSLTSVQFEDRVKAVFKEVTGEENISVKTNFFDLGISSLQTVQIKTSLEALFMERIDDVILYKYTSIRELSSYISSELLRKNTPKASSEDNQKQNSAKERMGKLLKSSI